ncbi:MAG: phosphopantetheine-binding protein [Gemmatimonadota bacterium]
MSEIERSVARCIAQSLGLTEGDVGAAGFELTNAATFSSFALLEMVVRLEETFSISVPDKDLTLERFASVASISQYVRERQGALGS